MKFVIGVAGEKGSGKGTFDRLVVKRSKKPVAIIKSSTILAETLTAWGLPLTRANLQNMAIAMNKMYGEDTLANAVRNRIMACKEEIVVFDGMRWPGDLKMLRSFEKHALVYITADVKIRYERLKSRNEKFDEGKATFKQFMAEEKAKTETFLPKLAEAADLIITNNGDQKSFEAKATKVIRELLS